MNFIPRYLFILGMIGALAACKKDDDPAPAPGPVTPPPPAGPYAIFQGTITTMDGTTTNGGHVIFPSDATVDAGTIALNGVDLDLLVPNYHVVTSSNLTFPTSLTMWTVEGGAGLGAFKHNAHTIQFPQMGDITSGGTITPADGYTLSSLNVSGADSVHFQIDGVPTQKFAGNVPSYTFTPAQLAGVQGTMVVATVTAITYSNTSIHGRNLHFRKAGRAMKMLQVQ